MEKAYEDTLSSIQRRKCSWVPWSGMNKKEVVINIGYKSEGVVPISEFRYKPDLAIGDKVEVYIEKQEDKGGQMVVSHKTARVHNAWGKVNTRHGDQRDHHGLREVPHQRRSHRGRVRYRGLPTR